MTEFANEKSQDMLNIAAQQRDSAMNAVVQIGAELAAAKREITRLEQSATETEAADKSEKRK